MCDVVRECPSRSFIETQIITSFKVHRHPLYINHELYSIVFSLAIRGSLDTWQHYGLISITWGENQMAVRRYIFYLCSRPLGRGTGRDGIGTTTSRWDGLGDAQESLKRCSGVDWEDIPHLGFQKISCRGHDCGIESKPETVIWPDARHARCRTVCQHHQIWIQVQLLMIRLERLRMSLPHEETSFATDDWASRSVIASIRIAMIWHYLALYLVTAWGLWKASGHRAAKPLCWQSTWFSKRAL